MNKANLESEEIRCPVCGGVMEWLADMREWICQDCGNRAFKTKDGQIYCEYD